MIQYEYIQPVESLGYSKALRVISWIATAGMSDTFFANKFKREIQEEKDLKEQAQLYLQDIKNEISNTPDPITDPIIWASTLSVAGIGLYWYTKKSKKKKGGK